MIPRRFTEVIDSLTRFSSKGAHVALYLLSVSFRFDVKSDSSTMTQQGSEDIGLSQVQAYQFIEASAEIIRLLMDKEENGTETPAMSKSVSGSLVARVHAYIGLAKNVITNWSVDDIIDDNGFDTTLLLSAVRGNQLEVVDVLVKVYKANVQLTPAARAKLDTIPLIEACGLSTNEMAKKLMSFGAKASIVTPVSHRTVVDAIDAMDDAVLQAAMKEAIYGPCPLGVTLDDWEECLATCASTDASGEVSKLAACVDRVPELLSAELPLPDAFCLDQDVVEGENEEGFEVTTTLLYTAARAGNIHVVQLLIAKGANPLQPIHDGNTPFHVACFRGHVGVLEALLRAPVSKQLNLLARNNYGDTIVSYFRDDVPFSTQRRMKAMVGLSGNMLEVLTSGDVDDLEKLLAAYHPDEALEIQSSTQGPEQHAHTTLLIEAVKLGKVSAVKMLLVNGASPNGIPLQGAAPISTEPHTPTKQSAPYLGAGSPVVLAKTGRALKIPGSATPPPPTAQQVVTAAMDERPLFHAVKVCHYEIASLLVDFGADVNSLHEDNTTSWTATERQFLVGLLPETPEEHLLRAMFSIDELSDSNASRIDVDEIICKIRSHNELGKPLALTPTSTARPLLHHCCIAKNDHVLRKLLESGLVDAEEVDATANTPLHLAAIGQWALGVEILLPFCRNLQLPNAEGKTARQLAPPGSRIVSLIDARSADKAQNALREYLATIPRRRDPLLQDQCVDANHVTTFAQLRQRLSRHVSKCLEALKAKLHCSNNPALWDVLRSVEQRAHSLLAGSWNLEELSSVPPPNLFPQSIEGVFQSVRQESCENVAAAVKKMFLQASISDSTVGAKFLRAISEFEEAASSPALDVVQATSTLSQNLAEAATSLVTSGIKHEFRPLSLSFIDKCILGKLQSKYLSTAESLFDRDGIVATSLGRKATATAVFSTTSDSISPLAALPFIKKEFLQFVEEHVKLPKGRSGMNVQKLVASLTQGLDARMKLDKFCARADNIVMRFLEEYCGEEMNWIVATYGGISAAENTSAEEKAPAKSILPTIAAGVGASATSPSGYVIERYKEECLKQFSRTVLQRYSVGKSLSDGHLVPSDLLASSEPYFVSMETVARIVRDLIEEPTPQNPDPNDAAKTIPAVTAESQNYWLAYLKQLRESLATETASIPVNPKEMFEKYLHPISLQAKWRFLPLFGHIKYLEQYLKMNDVILVTAGTGSGKSVLLPQFLTRQGYRVVVTQPRRQPVISLGRHVADMFGRKNVGWHVGGSQSVNPKGQLQFKTDTLCLNEMLSMDALPDDTAVVIDECHERGPTMDMLLLTILHKMTVSTAGQGRRPTNFKLVLASATVDSHWFRSTVKTFQGASFVEMAVGVQAPYKVTNLDPPSTLLPWPENKQNGPPPRRPQIAAQDAFDIIKVSARAKVLVFLPHVLELEAALRIFKSMTSVAAATLHANTDRMDAKLSTCRVLFSNNIAETSLTIPGLTHVLDFNLAMEVNIEDERNCRTLHIVQATQAQAMQRRGRLGRRSEGYYRSYYCPVDAATQQYDFSGLPKQNKSGFDILPNEELSQLEIKARHYLSRSLFQTVAPERKWKLSSLGLGVGDRPAIMRLIPLSPDWERIGAMLSFSGEMVLSFKHAVDRGRRNSIFWEFPGIPNRFLGIPHQFLGIPGNSQGTPGNSQKPSQRTGNSPGKVFFFQGKPLGKTQEFLGIPNFTFGIPWNSQGLSQKRSFFFFLAVVFTAKPTFTTSLALELCPVVCAQ